MKLNKMLALALSGVMAVSMLAGCSGAPSNGEEGTEVQPTTSNAVAVMNDAQDLVDFKADADFDAALAAAAKKAEHALVDKATFDIAVAGTGDGVYKELEKKLAVDAGLNTTSIEFAAVPADAKNGKSVTKTALYVVEADGLTEKAALVQIANAMKGVDKGYPEVVTIGTSTYEATYTGNVSVVTVNTADKGETATAYYIAVAVTQSVARDAIDVAGATT